MLYNEHVCHSIRVLPVINNNDEVYSLSGTVFNHFVGPLVLFLCIMALVRLKGSSFSFDSEYLSKFRVKKARTYFYFKKTST